MKVLPALLHLLVLLGPVADGRGRRPRRQAFSLHIPRVSRAELAANATLRSGHHAFVLTADETLPLGAGVESWSPRTLQKLFPSDDIHQCESPHPAPPNPTSPHHGAVTGLLSDWQGRSTTPPTGPG